MNLQHHNQQKPYSNIKFVYLPLIVRVISLLFEPESLET